MREFNADEQFKQLELFFEEARQQRLDRNAVFRPEPPRETAKRAIIVTVGIDRCDSKG